MRRALSIATVAALLLAAPMAHAATSYPEAIDAASDGNDASAQPSAIPDRLDLRSVRFQPHGPDEFQVVIGVEDLLPFDDPDAFADTTTFQAWWVHFSAAGHDFLLDVSQDADGDTYAQLDVRDVARGYGDHPRSDYENYRFDDVPVGLQFDESADRILVTLPREWMLTRPAPGVDGESISMGPGTVFQMEEAIAQHGQGTIEPSAIGVTANCGACFGVDFAYAHLPYVMDAPEANPWLIASAGPDVVTVRNPTSIEQTFPLVAIVDGVASQEDWIVASGASIDVPVPPGALVQGAASPVQWLGEVAAGESHKVSFTQAFHLQGAGTGASPAKLVVEAPSSVLTIDTEVSIDGRTLIGSWSTMPLRASATIAGATIELPLSWSDAEGATLVVDVAGTEATLALPAASGDETLAIDIPSPGDVPHGVPVTVTAWLAGDSGTATLHLNGPEPAATAAFDVESKAMIGATEEAAQALVPVPFPATLPHISADAASNVVDHDGQTFMQIVTTDDEATMHGPGWDITLDLPEPTIVAEPEIEAPDLTPVLGLEPLNSGAASIPDDKIPAGGTLRYYRDLYEQGIAHTEAYDAEWQEAEILGHLESEYLATDGVYVAGTVPSQGAIVEWGPTVVAHNPLGYQTQIGEAVQHGEAIAVQPDITLPAPVEDSFTDGLLEVVSRATIDGTEVTHSTTVLEGTIHADDRWHFLGQPGEALTVTLDTILPDDGWVAFEENGSIVAMPTTQADGLTTASGWFASFDPETQDVSGVVLAGDVVSTTITIADGVQLATTYDSVEDLLAARYLLDYTVADADATRYAGVLDLYNQDRTELGVIYANGDKSAGVGWAGSRADITADVKLEDWWGNLWGRGDSWDITVEAHASQGGKHLRFIAPADVLENSRYQFQLDGQDIGTQKVLSDGHTAVMTVEIDHFSLRAVTMKEIVPGVSWIFAAGFGIFGFVAAYEGALLANMKLRSRSAARGVSRTTDLEGVTLRSRAAQAGATLVKRTPPVRQVRCARCQTLQTHRDDATAVCINCRSPMLEAPEALPWN